MGRIRASMLPNSALLVPARAIGLAYSAEMSLLMLPLETP